jgi:molybdate transport system substrate-binding protein
MNLCRIAVAIAALCSVLVTTSAAAGKITVAAAADLRFAMDEIILAFKKSNPDDEIVVIYGSSGKFHTQIRHGAPYDMYFSADIDFPRALYNSGLAASEVIPYGVGRIVLWSATLDARKLTLASLSDPGISRIAIANPRHAPYGKRAEEALKAAGVWEVVESKLVFGENIAQTAQFVQSGSAQVGIIALSLALNPELANRGGYWLIPDRLHEPLEQGFVIVKQVQDKALAKRFADFIMGPQARAVLNRYGFEVPGAAGGE